MILLKLILIIILWFAIFVFIISTWCKAKKETISFIVAIWINIFAVITITPEELDITVIDIKDNE